MTLSDLKARLGTPGLPIDDVVPIAMMDPETGATIVGEVRHGGEDDEFVCCEVFRFHDDRSTSVFRVQAEPEKGTWIVRSVQIDGRHVTVQPEVALDVAYDLMTTIQRGEYPDVDAVLLNQFGLRRPIVGYL